MSLTTPPRPPPGTWQPARRAVAIVMRPLERFLHVEASSGIVLLAAAALALAWASSPFRGAYHHLWDTPIVLAVGRLAFAKPLHFWINDALMVVFFFVVGLEIRREIHQGELSDMRRAALPIAAALGGMIAPALIYLSLNMKPPARSGRMLLPPLPSAEVAAVTVDEAEASTED